MEASRKHGAFDTRWPCARTESRELAPTASPLRAEEAAEALDWDGFSGRYFNERSRHNGEARTAYAAYKQGREWRTTPPRLSVVPAEPAAAPEKQEQQEAGARRLLAAMSAIQPSEA